MPNILTQIKYYISSLSHISTALPKTWENVRRVLEQDIRNHISLDEYFNICEENGFTQRKDKLQLSDYLHDLGVCLHFQDDPLLVKTVILKPEWVTSAVYKVLDNDTVRRNFGKFMKDELSDIWYEEKYVDMLNELLQLMIKFKLCYHIPDTTDTYIAPQLLTENYPKYEWDENDNLLLCYKYEIMPKGIFIQFVIAMHKHIHQQEYIWKSGVILDKEHTKVEVIEYYDKREIKIRVTGRNKRKILTEVTYELDKIHSFYKNLSYNKLVPCRCQECNNNQVPHFFLFDILLNFVADRQYHIQCLKSYQMVNVLGLIDDFIDEHRLNEKATNDKMIYQKTLDILSTLAASRSISTENLVMGNIYQQSGKIGIGHMSDGTITGGSQVAGEIINEIQPTKLADLATEIQQLLNCFEQNNPTIIEAQLIVKNATERQPELKNVKMIEEAIKATPSLKQRLIAAGEAAYVETVKILLPPVGVAIEAVKAWNNPE